MSLSAGPPGRAGEVKGRSGRAGEPAGRAGYTTTPAWTWRGRWRGRPAAPAALAPRPEKKRSRRRRAARAKARLRGRIPTTATRSPGREPRRFVGEQGWAIELRVHSVFSRWATIVGARSAQHCTPSYVDGKLVVRTDSTAWATQLRLLAPDVVRRLNEELGRGR